MKSEIIYMLGIIAVGFAVNYSLRALPFLLFAGKNRTLPTWVTKFGAFLSPVIIAALIFYSYSGLAWKTAWPYLAGVLTVGLQLWKRNPLVSIVAGTVLYMCLLTCGCASSQAVRLDSKDPDIHYTVRGIEIEGEPATVEEVLERLQDEEIPHDRVVHIRLEPDVKDLRGARFLMACLAKAGYRRPVLVTERHSESLNLGKRKKTAPSRGRDLPQPKKIRYKGANE